MPVRRGLLPSQLNPANHGSSHIHSVFWQGIAGDAPFSVAHSLQIVRGNYCVFITPCSRYQDPNAWFVFVNWHHQGFCIIFCVAFIRTHSSFTSLPRNHIWDQKGSSAPHLLSYPSPSRFYQLSLNCLWPVLHYNAQFWKTFMLDLQTSKAGDPLCSDGWNLCTVVMWLFLLWICQVSAVLSHIGKPFKSYLFPYKHVYSL